MSSAARPLPTLATLAALAVLALQVVAAVGQSTSPQRLAWLTPYSGQTAYRLNVSVTGRPLSDTQIRARYGLPFRGHTALTPEALQRIVIEREGSSGTAVAGGLYVRLHTSRQRGPEQIWLWPQQ